MATLPELLKKTVELNGSDLHLSIQSPPVVRVHGELTRLDQPELTPAETKTLAYSVLTDAQKKRFEETQELDFSFGIRGLARFRCNLFNQRGAVGAVYRLIPERVRPFDELGLPPVIGKLAERARGLVLVTGPTGSGKSTTLAAMIDKINTERRGHILTIEDPIEYLHTHKGCLVRENIRIEIDRSAGDQSYIEDCHVCCRPIEFTVTMDERGNPRVEASREDD
jgi:twitching motility protein PilT